MKNVSKVTFVVLGTIIGAGFISGQEINLFFNKFGFFGIYGIIISGVIMALTIKKTCNIINENNIQNYQEFINSTISTENKYIKLILNNIVNIFLLISFFVMCAGLNSYFKQEFNIPIYITGIINLFVCYLIFKRNISMIIKINVVLMPIIIILIILLFFTVNNEIETYKIIFNDNFFLAILSGIIYASYNLILLIPILITLNKYINNKKQISIISIISSLIIIMLAIIIFFIINSISNLDNIEIPLIYIANLHGVNFHYIYSMAIFIAIFTAIISVGYGFLKNVSNNKKIFNVLSLILLTLSIFISYIGFSNLVSLLYPVFGIIGIIQIFFILKY